VVSRSAEEIPTENKKKHNAKEQKTEPESLIGSASCRPQHTLEFLFGIQGSATKLGSVPNGIPNINGKNV
jgi:hypothetical protein